MCKRPIGVFDSGLGGLTVLKELIKVLPNEDTVYFGDTARVPYGSRSKDTIMKYTFQAINFLISKNVKAIVIACNTATARALAEAQGKYDIPIVGVIDAGARASVKCTKSKVVGVIGTEATIKSQAYTAKINKIDEEITVIGKACPLFVPIVEEGWSNTDIARLTAKRYLKEVVEAGVDSIVLGCTHYPMLKRTIGEFVGSNIKLINPAQETAIDLLNVLKQNKLQNEQKENGIRNYYISDINERFEAIASSFLKQEIGGIDKVDIQKY